MSQGKTTIVIKDPTPWKVAKGHQPHRSGAGIHKDRRTHRLNTRHAQLQAAIKD